MGIFDYFPLLISAASLIVSIISIIYARRAYRFEVNKFAFEQSRKNVMIEFQNTRIADLKHNQVLYSDFRIINGRPEKVFIRYFSTTLNFGYFKGLRMRYMRVRLNANGGMGGGSSSSLKTNDIVHSYGGIETAIIDMNTNERLFFSQDKMFDVEPGPKSYAWRAITVIPKPILGEMRAHYHRLDFIELTMNLHPQERISKSASSISFILSPEHSGDVKIEQLTELFPRYKFQYKDFSDYANELGLLSGS